MGTNGTERSVRNGAYTDLRTTLGASTTSLISSRDWSSISTFDDSAHLANMPSQPIAIGELIQKIPLRPPHSRGVARSAAVQSSLPLSLWDDHQDHLPWYSMHLGPRCQLCQLLLRK